MKPIIALIDAIVVVKGKKARPRARCPDEAGILPKPSRRREKGQNWNVYTKKK
jgi:hypothetical protein